MLDAARTVRGLWEIVSKYCSYNSKDSAAVSELEAELKKL